jgi:hypothetical protein
MIVLGMEQDRDRENARLLPGMPAEPTGGWLDPDGTYWPCADDEHALVARRIAHEVLGLDAGVALQAAIERLRQHGWCRVLDRGWVVPGEAGLTDAQHDMLVDVARRHPSMGLREMDCLVAEDHWATGVTPDGQHSVLSGDLLPPASGGWIAPDGRMWRCRDLRHERLAVVIVKQLGIQGSGDPGTQLERLGFIHVLDDGGVMGAGNGMTQAQLDVLFDLARTYPSMREMLMKELELHRLRSALL